MDKTVMIKTYFYHKIKNDGAGYQLPTIEVCIKSGFLLPLMIDGPQKRLKCKYCVTGECINLDPHYFSPSSPLNKQGFESLFY